MYHHHDGIVIHDAYRCHDGIVIQDVNRCIAALKLHLDGIVIASLSSRWQDTIVKHRHIVIHHYSHQNTIVTSLRFTMPITTIAASLFSPRITTTMAWYHDGIVTASLFSPRIAAGTSRRHFLFLAGLFLLATQRCLISSHRLLRR